MYTRRWTSLRWFDKVRAHERLGMRPYPEIWHIYENNPPHKSNQGRIPRRGTVNDQDSELIRDLLNRYPDLRFTNAQYTSTVVSSKNTGNYIFDFIFHQKKLINDGMKKDKAFELTEQKFQDRFSQKIEAVQIANRLAMSNNARSVLSLAQQQSELEAHLKVKRIVRDIPLYQQAQTNMNKTLQDLEREQKLENRGEHEEEEDFEEDEFVEFGQGSGEGTGEQFASPGEEYVKKYTRVLHKIVPSQQEAELAYDQHLNKEKRTQIIESFAKNTKHMFDLYYERAAALDRLNGLTDKEILDTVVTSPKKIKKQSKQLLNKLAKYNIKLDSKGEVDFTECPYPNITRKYMNNPLVKIALMQADLEYEFPHREAQLEAARKARQEFEESKREREKDNQLQEEEERKRIELEQGSTSEQSPFHQQYNIQYPQSEKYRQKVKVETAKEKAQRYAQEHKEENLSAEASYRVFETYDERMVRLEKKWLKSRLATLEAGVERPSESEKTDLLDKAVNKLRRLKFLIEQKHSENAKDLLFKEHRVFSEEELKRDKDNHYEKLNDYLRLPDEKRRLHTIDEIDDNRILTMIKRKEIVEDTTVPYENTPNSVLTEKDDVNLKLKKVKDILYAQETAHLGRPTKQKQKAFRDDAEEGDEDLLKIEQADAGKEERKRLIEHIKVSSSKKKGTKVGKKNAKNK